MSSKGLRGFSAGIIAATGVFAVAYFYISPQAKGQPLTQNNVENYLSQHGQIAISSDDYNTLQTTKAKASGVKGSTSAVSKPAEKPIEVPVVVSRGTSTGEVCDFLQKSKIIKNSSDFLKYLRSQKLEGAVRFGTHKVNNKMTYPEIAKAITST